MAATDQKSPDARPRRQAPATSQGRTRRLLARLSFSNVMATGAVFVALGGGAYAATALPFHGVKQRNIAPHAVTKSKLLRGAVSRSKLAPHAVDTRQLKRGAVSLRRLSKRVRARLSGTGGTGPQGPKGDAGPTGPQGPKGDAGADALGASTVNYAAAVTQPAQTVILDTDELVLRAACELDGNGDVTVSLSGKTAENATLQSAFVTDSGTDPDQQSDPLNTFTGNNQFAFTAGTFATVGGPSTSGGSGFVRANARSVLVGQSGVLTLDLFELISADTGRCQIAGSALPSS